MARSFRPEHRSALYWLNSISVEGSGFFGIEVHTVRIEESPVAVYLEVVVEPDDFSRQVRTASKVVTRARARYLEWWDEFLPDFHVAHPGWSNARKPSYDNWMHFSSGRSGINYSLSLNPPMVCGECGG